MALQLQMNWEPLLKKRKNGPPLGLKNLGNTCYLNSVLQCLTHTPPLANFCLKLQHAAFCDLAAKQDKKSECPFCLLERRIARSLSIDLTLDTPAKIINGLKIFAEHFRLGRQEDAHEFLRYVIDACHNTCLRLKKLQQQQRRKLISNGGCGEGFSGSTVVKEIFGGALQSQVKCLACGAESNKVDEIMDISIDVVHSSSLKEAFQRFFHPETLDGNDKYKCDNCKKLVAARKQMSILQAPNILVIQLKRFEGIFGGKIDKAITFEEVLVLSSFMCKASQDPHPHPEYNLFATIVHSGYSLDSGHYYAYIKDAMGHWYCCNDSYVSLATLQEVFSEKVYLLFFSRTKQRPVPAKKTLVTNGTKSYGCNGNDASKIPKDGHVVKSIDSQQYVDHHSQKVNSSTSKADQVHSSPQWKIISSGNSGAGKFPGPVNGKIIVHKKESNGINGHAKASICTTKNEKKMPLSEDRNGFSQSKFVDAVNGEKSKSFPLEKGNGEIRSKSADSLADGCEDNGTRNRIAMGKGSSYEQVQNGSVKSQSKLVDAVNGEKRKSFPLEKGNGEIHRSSADSVADGCEDNGTRNRIAMGKGSSYEKVQNGSVKSHADNSVPKRKLQEQDLCTLLSEDSQSRAKCKELKEDLGKEASLFLRSCGWSDEVYSFMRAKKLCAREAGNDASNSNELKRLLIADAKSTFTSQIPESLKANLIKRLKSFSRIRQHFDP